MIPVQTKEHLIYLMQSGLLRLSKYDLRFVQNLQNISLSKSSLTTNQVTLFDKLVVKYKRQLHKHGLTDSHLEGLEWQTSIINSDPKFTEAYVNIDNDTITFRAPFQKKFVDAFYRVPHNTFKWLKDKKVYESSFNTHALKSLIKSATEYYPVVNYCPVTVGLLNTIEPLSAKYWSPTLIKLHDRYLIAATNKFIDEALKDVELSANIDSLIAISSSGVTIDESVTCGDPLLTFMANYFVDADFSDVDTVVKYLSAMKCDAVLIAGQASMLVQYRRILKDKLKEGNIHVDDKHNIILDARIDDYENPVMINLSSMNIQVPSKFKKIIRMKNSTPVVVR